MSDVKPPFTLLTKSIWDAAFLLTRGFDFMGIEPSPTDPSSAVFRITSLERDPEKEVIPLRQGTALVNAKVYQRRYLELRKMLEPYRKMRTPHHNHPTEEDSNDAEDRKP